MNRGHPKIAAARMAACRKWPFASNAILSLVPVEKQGLGTAAVDEYWRLYYDPEFCEEQTAGVLATLIMHEVSHLLLRHHKRAKSLVPDTAAQWYNWNKATDMAINNQLRSEGAELWEGAVLPETDGYPAGKSSEHYFNLMQEQDDDQPDDGDGQESESGGDGTEPDTEGSEPGEDSGDSNGEVSEPGSEDETDGSADGPTESGCSPDGDQAESDAGGSGEPCGDDHSAGRDGDSACGGGDESDQCSGEAGSGCAGTEPGQSGSCADGQQRPWELGPPEGGSDGLEEHEAEQVIHKVAEAVEKHCGDGAGNGWSEWAVNVREPRIDPHRLVRRALQSRIDQVQSGGSGKVSYRRLSRRPSGLIRPRSFKVTPKIRIIVDTSGSMSRGELEKCLGLVSRVINGLRLRDGVEVICGDTQAASAQTVFSPDKVRLAGRGGTNMGRIMASSLEADRPCDRPDILVVCTDGYTPWPAEKLAVPAVAVITDDEVPPSYPVPDWMDHVCIGD